MRFARRVVTCLAVIALGCVALSAPARAADVYSTGFESPTFTTGALDEQDGWVATTQATITNSLAASGSQSVGITLTTNGYTGQFYDKAHRGIDNPTGSSPQVTISQDVRISTLNEADWRIAVLGSFIVTNTVTFHYNGDILLNNVKAGASWTAGVWKTVVLELDFTTHKADLYYGGSKIANDIGFHNNSVGFDMLVLATDDYAKYGSTMYYDNLAITTVPEPATMCLTALGLVAMASRRRRR